MANFITSVSGGTVRTDSYWVGFQAQVGASQDLMVSALGRWVVSAGQTHLVQLLDGGGNLLAQATVGTAGIAANSFAWTTLANPVRLFAGTTFFVMSQEQNGDPWLDNNFTLTVTAGDASAPGAAYSVAGTSPGLPTVVAGSAYVPPNFQYTTAAPLPPLPSGSGTLITSITGGTPRHNFGGWVGFRFVVGSKDLPVLGLGRWIIPNVTGTVTALHPLQLLDDSGNLLATTTLDITGKPTGAFSYQRLNNPITLPAGTAYYLMVGETNNTDEWLNADAALTTSADATITHNAYSSSGGLPTTGAGLSAYVPPDLYYQFAATAQNITAIGIASTTAFGTASVSAGAVNLAPAGIASTNLFGTAAVVPGAVGISGTGIASTNAFGTASLSRGAVNISAAGIASTNTFGTAAVAVSIDVVLLCHFDNAFVDASTYAHTLTPTGLCAISATNSKFGAGSAFYSIGNATSSISTNNSADFHFGAAPFTIEAWCYATQAGTGDGYNPILAEWDAVLGNVSFFFNVFPAYQFFWSPDGTAYSYLNASPNALPLNTWTHVAADRDSSGVLRIYVNGVVVASVSCPDSFYPSTYICKIGNDASAARAFPGYIDELRVVRGTAMYGGPFTPPTAPFLPPDSAGALNIAPTGIASTTAFGTASVSPGALNITATGIASTTTFGTASLSPGAVNISAVGIAKTNAFGTASLSPGAVNISATGIGSTTAFGTAALLGTVSLSTIGIASTNAFGTAGIASGVGGPRSISAAGIASTNVFGNTSISAGALTPRALMSPHGNICCDPAYRPLRGPQTLQQVHFRPAKPYPRYILGPGIGVLAPAPLPPRATVTLATPPYRLRPIAGPSATGPWTYRDTRGPYPVFRSGGVGTGQSLGLT